MTEMEMRQQRIALRIDLEDAERTLVHQRERAIRQAEALEGIVRKIRQNAALEPSRGDFDVESELRMRLSLEEIGTLKASGDGAVALIAELRQERQKVFHLRERDNALTKARC